MKHTLLALSAVCALTGCAGVRVAKTDVATGATNPSAIYVRSFLADDMAVKGRLTDSTGEKPIRGSLAPAEYSQALKQELEKIAPAMVLAEDEVPTTGWLVESNLEVIHGGSPTARAFNGPVVLPTGHGRSELRIHVRVTDIGGRHVAADSKSSGKHTGSGRVIYEFDLAGGSGVTGRLGSITAPGLGYAHPFDYKNAAERVMMALSVDPHAYGTRSSTTIR